MRSAAERGSGAAGAHAGAMVGPLLQNLVLSVGDNEEMCYCLKAWQALPRDLRRGGYPSKEDALKVRYLPRIPIWTRHRMSHIFQGVQGMPRDSCHASRLTLLACTQIANARREELVLLGPLNTRLKPQLKAAP